MSTIAFRQACYCATQNLVLVLVLDPFHSGFGNETVESTTQLYVAQVWICTKVMESTYFVDVHLLFQSLPLQVESLHLIVQSPRLPLRYNTDITYTSSPSTLTMNVPPLLYTSYSAVATAAAVVVPPGRVPTCTPLFAFRMLHKLISTT